MQRGSSGTCCCWRLDLAIEMLLFEFGFVNSMDTMVRFLDAVGLDNVKATTDISHLWLTRAPPSELERLKGRVAHVISRTATGRTMATSLPGEATRLSPSTLPQSPRRFLRHVSIELQFPPDPDAMLSWVEEAYGTTAQLLSEAGVRNGKFESRTPATAALSPDILCRRRRQPLPLRRAPAATASAMASDSVADSERKPA